MQEEQREKQQENKIQELNDIFLKYQDFNPNI